MSIRGSQAFTNCSIGLQLNSPNVRSTKWSVCKAIWQSEQFPGCNMTSYRGSFKDNSFEINQFSNQPLKIIVLSLKIILLLQTVLESEARSLLPTDQLDFSWTLEMSDRQNNWFAGPSYSLGSSMITLCII